MSTTTPLKIGEVAQQSALPVKTIRYYADLGLLSAVMGRSPAGYRLFSPAVLNRLAFIKRAQSLGLSLQEIGKILGVHDGGHLPCGVVKQQLHDKLAEINTQIDELVTLRGELQGILSGWQDFPAQNGSKPTICPNLQP
ncbi:heavy metal-responsive transcriptional regulator [[Limnothrix rosea] IAM M-220]|uniref:heavy metal-responsive transcriptional regulator n=1 Tax=[Limnothrix rosea] IAM M-220 TaxID=454133 RepID=UPI0009592766|nr:heavy metal-responsive transcriptional regulator [[Limnothrix rosea] IAM M-220]OKH18425.1 heavy metal-responsive transcriptional regulator [[Limnothrix rosea] IAM M-220]